MDEARIRALPCWWGAVEIAPLHGGLSNENYVVTDGVGKHVVRFGTDYPFHHVDRLREVMTTRAAHAAGFGPAVEHAGPGVMVTAFVDARTWGAADMAAEPARIAALLRDFHGAMPGQVSGTAAMFWPFHVIRDYGRTLGDGGERLALAAELEAAQVPLPIVFGHHDMLPANVLDDGKRLWLIDYEYAAFGTAMFDLAGVAANSGMDDAQARALLTAYFGAPPDVPLWRAFVAMQCASLLREAMWGMVSALHLNAPGVDYAAYADENLTRMNGALARFRAL